MNRRTVFTSVVCFFLLACHNQNNAQQNGGTGTTREERKISKRDYSITSENAYNDLSLDSNAVVKFITTQKLPDSIADRITSFYNARNYRYAWFSTSGLTEQALGFWNLHNYEVYNGDTTLRHTSLQKTMDALTADEDLSISRGDKNIQSTELQLTEHFITYVLENFPSGFVKRKEMERFIPVKKEDPIQLADSLLNKKHKDNKYFDQVNDDYKLLKEQLVTYLQVYKAGGFPVLPAAAKDYKPSSSSPAIRLLKKRLQLTGDLPATDTTAFFDDTLRNAIMQVEQQFGYSPTGKVTTLLIKDLNVPVKNRVEQILINLNRMRWMPREPEGRWILVNIPEFVLHVLDGKNKVFDMNVVVGKEGHNTMMFTGKLSTVVFSPYWNVPQSIVKKELLEKIGKDPDFLDSQDMEVVGTEGGLPKIRQRPGDKNSLGHVKFLFPNSFNIYFHDSPAKELFNKDKRAYSHGCIRLSEPEKMAEYLLSDNPNWPASKIYQAMYSGTEQSVSVKKPIPVFITYYTSWVDENGHIHFRDDIYGRDSLITSKMFY